jgi:hypothetical protein
MSINVETIGEALMVQHFVLEPHFCRLTSISDAITMKGCTKVLLWELSAKKIDDDTCEYSNHIHASATDEFLAFIKKRTPLNKLELLDSRPRRNSKLCQKH